MDNSVEKKISAAKLAEKAVELKEGYLYDPVAQKQRKATDEEFVRQEMIKTLVSEYGYPLTSMQTEFRNQARGSNEGRRYCYISRR